MSNYLTILTDIKTKMESITDIGKVYDYERYSTDMATFINLFKVVISGVEQIRGWEISRFAVTEHKTGAYFRHHKFRISGYMGLKDSTATDKTFQQLVDAVSDKFRNSQGGSSWDYKDGDNPQNSPVQVPVIDVRTFGSVLCHHSEIILSVTERII